MEHFSIKNAIRYGWETFKKRPWYLVGVTLLLGIIDFLIPSPEESHTLLVNIGLSIVLIVLGVYLQLASANFAIKSHDHIESVRLRDLWRPELFPKFLGALLLSGLAIGALVLIPGAIVFGLYLAVGPIAYLGLALLIPAIILGIALSMVEFIVIDKGLGPVAAFKESLRLTKGTRGKLFLFYATTILIALLGLLCLLVGLLIALPVLAIARVHVYRVLDGERSSIVEA